VRSADAYGPSGYTITGTLAVPTASQVLAGVAVDATVGNVVLPTTAQVMAGVTFGPSSGETGTYSQAAQYSNPGAVNVLNGVSYLYAGTTFTGALGVDLDSAAAAANVAGAAGGVLKQAQILQHSAVTLVERIVDGNGNPITAAAVQAIAVNVYDRNATGTTYTASPSPASVISATLLPWSTDAIGYNAKVVLPGSAFPNGNTTYRVEIVITPEGGLDSFYVAWDLQCVAVYSSIS
jgi:hypothetical protein